MVLDFVIEVEVFLGLGVLLDSLVNVFLGLLLTTGSGKSSVDYLRTGRGVVLGRAATTLRSIETQPFDW